MKKLLSLFTVILVCSACNAENTVDVLGVECQWVADGMTSTLVKCPFDSELDAIRSVTPSAMFQEGDFGEKHFTEYMTEFPNSILVNVVPGDCGKDTTGYRIIVRDPVIDDVSMYAVAKCDK